MNEDAQFAARLHGKGFLDPRAAHGDFLEVLDAFEVGRHVFRPRARARGADGVRGTDEDAEGALGGHVVVVGGDGVHDGGAFSVALGQLGPDQGVGALHLVIDGLADVMQEPGAFGEADVQAQLGRHQTRQLRDFDRMVEDVLRIAVTEVEAAEELDQVGAQGRQAGLSHGFVAEAEDGLVHFLGDLRHNLLDARWMNPAVLNQPHHGLARNLAADGVKAREQNRARGVVNQDGHAGGGFEGADVASLAADDAAFEFIALEGDGGGGGLEGVFAGVSLDGEAENVTRLGLGLGAGVLENMAGEGVGIAQRLLLDFSEQRFARLGLGQTGDGLEPLEMLALLAGQFLFAGADGFHLGGEGIFLSLERLFLFDQTFQLGVDERLALGQPALQLGAFGAAGGEGLLDLLPQLQRFAVGGQAGIADNSFGFIAGLAEQSLGLEGPEFAGVAVAPPEEQIAERRTHGYWRSVSENIQQPTHSTTGAACGSIHRVGLKMQFNTTSCDSTGTSATNCSSKATPQVVPRTPASNWS